MLMAKAKVSKASASKAVEPPAPPVTNEEPVNEVVDDKSKEVSSHDAVLNEFTSFQAQLQAVSSQLNLLRSTFKQLEKNVQRELRQAEKLNKKKKAKGNRKPSGFVKPTRISKELATFLDKPHGTEMARTEVTREINNYIRKHKLQDKDNGRKINPDKSLKKLLKLNAKEELTYFNLQKYMSPHFHKAGQVLSDTF